MAKIMYIHHSGNIGGAGVSLSHVLSILSEQYEVLVYCPATPLDMAEYLIKCGFRVITYNQPIGAIANYSGGPKIISRTFVKGLYDISICKPYWRKEIQRVKPDIVIVNSIILCWMGNLIHEVGAKAVCFVRETFKENPIDFINPIIKHILSNKFDGVFFISKYDKNVSKCKAPVTGVVRNCIDLKSYEVNQSREEICRKIGINPKCFNVLFVGGISKLKGTHIALQAIKRLRELKEINLIIAGYAVAPKASWKNPINWYRERYTRKIFNYIKAEKLEGQVKFIGVRKDIQALYKACDVLIFPSTKPHQARPIFEAGAAHLPVIVSNFKQIKEYVEDGVNGLYFTANNDAELAKKIQYLFYNRELSKKMGQNNYIRTIENHEISKVKEKLLKYIDKILVN